ncbi:zinc-ribbon domain and TM2 domain-containing protein [Rahnella sp. C60]|uniref:Zinc-ribbon domain and TM2 domain-containing protein n=2 Tax=Rahnella perminowiae TaxID=2816244 RepID=A0ABS6L468_9GAMM|nr:MULTISPECIES: TM2 domain-containing protein [Rahnella]UJD92130.1 zinc-ribbon domain and TM2 domain-containing protein [Rahnella aquatilis]MBU9816947.1 zinc-ribbon domain and TM2 domain-containing protein [Rahnella perminowiae]MBU9826109.1 zinc-ribbon domain and TM2 domain-containing protein [Rahnella perminowiae]MBU9836398.1 zinc-ribbon domain and TM2 domain-containing protein [Rahnella perminowiae]MCR9003505.1 zinc-ribbon domain and TM2 domain-containing protein [Rahnella perminowiae]
MGSMVFCRGCGKEIHESAKSCPHCGATQNVNPQGTKSRVAAALLAFFLGGFGVHKFYLGKIGQGFLYLIFCWTFIPSIIAFIEFIIYLCDSDENFAKKYG